MFTHTTTAYQFSSSPLLTIHVDGYIEADDNHTGHTVRLNELASEDIQAAIFRYIYNVEANDENKKWLRDIQQMITSRLTSDQGTL
jgi:hypothetical protein